jgi:arginase family enzyme
MPVYVSFDVDSLDPAYAPGTGTPVIGGLTTYEAQQFLRALPKMNLVGGDVVEIIPQYDPTQITQLFAVDVMFELLSHMTVNG